MPIRKIITYTDPSGTTCSTEYCFSLDEDEFAEMTAYEPLDADEFFSNIIESNDFNRMNSDFKKILYRSVCMADDVGLIKNETITREFFRSGAYSSLFMELLTIFDVAEVVDFFASVLPDGLAEKYVNGGESREYTDEELLEMSDEEFRLIAGSDEKSWNKRHLMIAYQRKSNAA